MTAQPTAGPDTRAAADPTSTPVTIPVALADGGEVEWEVHAELFVPAGPMPSGLPNVVSVCH